VLSIFSDAEQSHGRFSLHTDYSFLSVGLAQTWNIS